MVSSQSTQSPRPAPAFSSPCAFSISALKIAPCRRPSQQKGLSYSQRSAVSCQPPFSFSPSAAAACVTAFTSFPPGCHPELSEGSAFRLSPFCAPSVSAFNSPNLSPFNFKLSTVNSPSLSPFFATLTSPLQPPENTATLSPAFATLTRHVNHNSFVCHSYKKHPGWGAEPPRIASHGCSQLSNIPTFKLSNAPLLPVPTPPATKSHRIRTSIKPVCKSFVIRTSKTKDLKPFRIRTYGKTPGGRVYMHLLEDILPKPLEPTFFGTTNAGLRHSVGRGYWSKGQSRPWIQ
jgi:hypothetical protein